MDKLQNLRIFIEVAKQQSFSAAAEVLALSAPATTRSIAALEKHLGVKLFNRTTRLVRLTESGARFLQDAKRIIDDLEQAEAAVIGVYKKPSGTLTITAPVLFGEKHIIPIVTEYLKLHPNVAVKAMLFDRVTNLLEEEIDIAIRIGHLKDSGLYASEVGKVRRIVCAAPSYFDAKGRPNTPTDLADHEIIFPTTFETTSIWQFQNQNKKEQVRLTPRLHCNQNAATLSAVISGHGISRLMSYQIGEELESGKLQSALTEFEEPPLPINVIHVEGRRANAKIRAFVDLTVERLRSNPFINPKI